MTKNTIVHAAATVLAALSFLAAARLAHGAETTTCTAKTTIRADGAIVTHTTCERPAHRTTR